MVVVGPSQIFFDALNGDEFKIFIPNGYNNLPHHLHPLMINQSTIEIFCMSSKDKTFKLANEMTNGQNNANWD